MKNIATLLILCFSFLSVQSQIVHQDFGENGWRIALNENYAWDVDDDGTADLYINQQLNELGFTPLFNLGCLASPSGTAYTPFQARELKIFEAGEITQLTDLNLFDYIDTDRGSVYEDDNGEYAIGWENGMSQYVGFVIIQNFNEVKDGWMRIAVDESSKELVIYEFAHNEFSQPTINSTGIVVGETGVSSVKNYVDNLSLVSISPNPASDMVNISLEYYGDESLGLNVVDLTGREMYRHQDQLESGKTDVRLQTESWSGGTYFLHIRSATGVEVKKINISK